MLTKTRNYVRTIRFLKPVQILGQIRRLLRNLNPRLPRVKLPKGELVPTASLASPPPPPGIQENSEASLTSGTFSFLHAKRNLGWPPDWTVEDASLLWNYNLHYFEWIWALPWEKAREAVEDWISFHPPDPKSPGWAPYPITLRLQNWTLYFFGQEKHRLDQSGDFRKKLEQSILKQGAFLRRNTEYHLLGNHYLANGVTLSLLGSIFKGAEASKWRKSGLRILRRQLPEQILPDGTHFELSPMYQSHIAYQLLLLADYGIPEVSTMAQKALAAILPSLACLTHPDGGIALLNDSAQGIYNPPEQLFEIAGRLGLFPRPLGPGPWRLPEAGYYGWKDGRGNYLVYDAGKIGPDYIPGHAHGDIFSFELSLDGKRIVIDGGLCQYREGKMRDWCRSTQAHNTVEIEGMDQAEFWGSFRVARRGYPHDISVQSSPRDLTVEGWHDGYQRLAGKPIHWRRISFQEQPLTLKVTDRVRAGRLVTAVSRIHFHPEVSLNREEESCYLLRRGETVCRLEFFGDGKIESTTFPYCPGFGLQMPAPCLTISARSDFLTFGYQLKVL